VLQIPEVERWRSYKVICKTTTEPLSPHLISDDGLEYKGNIKIAALVTTAHSAILLLYDVLGSLYVQPIEFLWHRDPYTVTSLETVVYSSYCNTVEWFWWDWSLSLWPTGFLQCFDTVSWVIWPVKIVPEMTHKVSSGTLILDSLTHCKATVCDRKTTVNSYNGPPLSFVLHADMHFLQL